MEFGQKNFREINLFDFQTFSIERNFFCMTKRKQEIWLEFFLHSVEKNIFINILTYIL